MSGITITKQYKFKMYNVLITVDIDNTFYNIFNYRESVDSLSYIKFKHYHMAHELFFIGNSPLMFFTDSDAFEYKNCILSIPPKFNHLSFRKKDYRILFSFTCDENDKGQFANFLKALSESNAPIKLATDKLIMSYMSELFELILHKNSSEEIVISLFKLIFHKIYTLNANRTSDAILSTSESYILKIDKIINDFQNDINLQTVADELHLSTKQASRIITKTYKKPLSALLTEKRLAVASALLLHTDKTISEIVEYINFPSESYFYQQFKKAYGCTPYKYKKAQTVKIFSENDTDI